MELRGKTILVISPQRWGKMHVAKHHYAIELAKRGNQVIFLNPPDQALSEAFKWENDPNLPGLHFLTYRPFFPLKLRFHFRLLFDVLMWLQIARLLRYLNQSIDVVWCFEPNLYSNLWWFKAKFNIYHPVDELFYNYQIKVGHSAHLILSVTHEILSKFDKMPAQKRFIHHGLADEFEADYHEPMHSLGEGLKIGYTGNLLRQDIDTKIFAQIIQENPSVDFHLWGAFQLKQSNFDGEQNSETLAFISFLQGCKNVMLHGVVSPKDLAREIQKMDAFIICYDIKKDQSKGTNYHKLMEYISTGKVVVSNNITTFSSLPHLVTMTTNRDNNQELPPLFHRVVNDIMRYNAPDLQKGRKAFARQNTYAKQIDKIESLIQELT